MSRGSLEMIFAMLISGTIGWFVLQAELPVMEVVFWRCVFGALALGAICWYKGAFHRRFLTLRTLFLTSLGGVLLVTNWLLLFQAYSYANISIATTVYNTQPFMLLLLGIFFLGEKFTFSKLFWLILSFTGMLMIVLNTPHHEGEGNSYLLGIVMALAAAFFYALISLITKRLTGIPSYLIAFIQVTIGILMLWPWAEPARLPLIGIRWSYLISLGVLHTGLMYVLLYSAIQKLPTHIIGTLSFIYPIAAIVVDRIAYDQMLSLAQYAGGAAILLAAAGMNLGWQLPAPKQRIRKTGEPN